MVSVYTSLFYIEQCPPVVIIQPMFALAKVCLGEGPPRRRSASAKVRLGKGPPWRRFASAKVRLSKGLPRQRSASAKVRHGKGPPRRTSASTKVCLGKGQPRRRSVSAKVRLTVFLLLAFAGSEAFFSIRTWLSNSSNVLKISSKLSIDFDSRRDTEKSYTVPLKNSSESHLYKMGHLINHLC